MFLCHNVIDSLYRPAEPLLTLFCCCFCFTATIGITEYAAKSLGDVVYVELPELELEVSAGEPVGAVESVKSASDVLTPVSGKIIEGNDVLSDKPKTINASPEGEGWIAKIEVNDPSELDALLDEQAYLETVGES